MTTYNYTNSDSTDNFNPALSFDPDIRVIAIDGDPCEVWYEAGRYYAKRLSTEEIYRFTTLDSFRNFTDSHTWEPEPTPEAPIAVAFPVLEISRVFAVSAPTTDHIICIAAPADVTTCESCREALPSGTDGRLCSTCKAKQDEIVTPTKRTSYEARNELRKLFTQLMSNEQYKTRRAELLEEITNLEAAEKAAHVGSGTASYLYQKLGIEDALSDFTARFKCSPTHIYISKYDTAPDVEGAIIERRAAVLPGNIWMGAR